MQLTLIDHALVNSAHVHRITLKSDGLIWEGAVDVLGKISHWDFQHFFDTRKGKQFKCYKAYNNIMHLLIQSVSLRPSTTDSIYNVSNDFEAFIKPCCIAQFELSTEDEQWRKFAGFF